MYPAAESITKTTFYLSDSRRMRLKSLAAKSGKTVTELLAEGADLVLLKYGSLDDKTELARRAHVAKERLRAGLYAGPAAEVDDVLYPKAAKKARRRKKK